MRVIVQTPSTSNRNATQQRADSVGGSGMGKELQCKVKLVKGEGQDDEIRRFKLMEQHGPPSFVNLMIQIASIFPELQFGNFKVFWKDEHDELIAFSSDMELAAALDSVQNGLLNLTVKIEAGMMGMAGFPGVHVPPLPGFMPPPNQAPPQQGTSPGFPPESHFSGRGPMGQFAYGAFPGQPNMFYGMGSGTFGNQVPPGAGPTSYSWSSTSNDANGSRQQAQYQAATSKQQQQQPKQQQQQQPPQQQQQQAQPEPPKSSTKEPEPTPAPAPDIRSSISRNQEKLEMLLRMKNLPSTDDS